LPRQILCDNNVSIRLHTVEISGAILQNFEISVTHDPITINFSLKEGKKEGKEGLFESDQMNFSQEVWSEQLSEHMPLK
jgi:hypothetical protein